jgi:hypothetical protein
MSVTIVLIIIFVVVVLALLLAFNLGGNKKRAKEVAWLRANGKKVQATVSNVKQETGKGGYNYLIIECAWTDPDTKTGYKFFSDWIFNATVNNLQGKNAIDVYIDPKNPLLCFVDIPSVFPNIKFKDGNWWNS